MNKLNANSYNYKNTFRFAGFENILNKITLCYKDMITSDCNLINDENKIRDYLFLNYLIDDARKEQFQLLDYKFDKETEEYDGHGKVDLRVLPINPFISDRAYFIIECKRIDNKNTSGTSGLNGEYISNGMNRFLKTDKYSSYYNTNAMIGFVVEQLDIDSNVGKINLISNNLLEGNCLQNIQKENFIPNFSYHYSSHHTRIDGSDIKLYHLMYDVSSKIV